MSIEAMKQALEALELAKRSYGVMLLSDPPQDAWKTRGVNGEIDKSITSLRQAIAEAEKQEPVVIPEGFSLVAVKGFDELMLWLDRCEYKGHLENCPDLIEPYEAFDYRTIDTRPEPKREPLTDEQIAPMFAKRQSQETIGEKDAWYLYAWGVNDGEAAHGIKGKA